MRKEPDMAMHYGEVAGVGKRISRLVQGTSIGSIPDLDAQCRLYDDVYALGCNAIDTAYVYCDGNAERSIGRWIKTRGLRRDDVVIIDKGAHPDAGRPKVTPKDITADLQTSLDRLDTSYIDIYLLHRDNTAVPVGPIVEVLDEHRRAGRIRAYGASNWSAERIREANAYADARGLPGFAASSPNLSLAVPRESPWAGCVSISGPAGAEERAWYAAQQMPIFSWSSMAMGFFSGRFRRDNLNTFTGYFDKLVVKCFCTEENFQRLDRAEALGRELGLSLPQVALAWLFGQGLNMFALVACATKEQMATNIAALDAVEAVKRQGL
jgi:aryl-alcohol dehydrogenase-like predicted oxidoreductase